MEVQGFLMIQLKLLGYEGSKAVPEWGFLGGVRGQAKGFL